jgi:hypothetical protein
VQSEIKTHGVGAVLEPLQTPNVSAGHVGAWIGLGGTDQGPGGTAEWIQVGFSAFPNDRLSRIYYEVTVAGAEPKYVELDSSVRPGERHSFKVLETARQKGWWRVWLDGKAVTAPIHLPGSHERWHPEAEAESRIVAAFVAAAVGARSTDVEGPGMPGPNTAPGTPPAPSRSRGRRTAGARGGA